jgi:hypothetical protein
LNLLLVNGEWVPAQSQQTFVVTNPMNGKVIFHCFLVLVELRKRVSDFKSVVDRCFDTPMSCWMAGNRCLSNFSRGLQKSSKSFTLLKY